MTNATKVTKFEDLPENWQCKSLKEVVSLMRGFSYGSSQITRDFPTSVRIININDFDKVSGWKVTPEFLYLLDTNIPIKFKLQQSELLIANTDMSKGIIIGAPLHIDKIPERTTYIFSSDLTRLSPLSDQLNTKFLFYFLNHEPIRKIARSYAQGTNVLHLNHDLFKETSILIPPLLEQQKIAEILSITDDIIQNINEQISQGKKLKKDLMQTLFTKGVGHTKFKMTEIGEMPEEWILKNLGDNEISLIKMGQSPPSGTYNKAGDGLPFLQGNAEFGVKHPSFTIYCSLPLKITQPGDILISVRAPVGDVNIANSKYCIGRGLATIRSNPRSMDGLFLYYTLNHFKLLLERISTGSTFKAIGKEQLHSLKIPLPKIVEQQKIAEILTTVDRKIELLNEKKKEAEKLKRGLMDKLLTGKVRVKV